MTTPPANGPTAPAQLPAGPRLDPWNDPALTPRQRVAYALDAALALGEALATQLPGTPEQEAYAAGWRDGWAASERDQALAWRHLAAQVRALANQPSHAELTARRAEPNRPCRQRCGSCSACVRAAWVARHGGDHPGGPVFGASRNGAAA